jgi:hypothetical protein
MRISSETRKLPCTTESTGLDPRVGSRRWQSLVQSFVVAMVSRDDQMGLGESSPFRVRDSVRD